jgi:LPS export ABC transporter protein LptC
MRGRRISLKTLLGLLILGCLGGVAILGWNIFSPGLEKERVSLKADGVADLRLDRVHYTDTRDGIKEWELEAASAVYYKEQNTIVLEKVRATFFGKDQESYVLVGEKGRFDPQTKVIEVFEGVSLDSSNGYHLRTRSLKYRADQRELSTLDPVEMRGPEFHVEGVGMVVELNRQRLKILGGVTTTLSSLAMMKSPKAAR